MMNDSNYFAHLPLEKSRLDDVNHALNEQIKQRQQVFMNAFREGNAKAAAAVYHPKGYFMPSGKNPVQGREEIENFFKEDMKEGVQTATIITEEVNGSDEWAFERGSYFLDGSQGQERGSYIQVWKKMDNEWYIYNDCFNVVKAAGSQE